MLKPVGRLERIKAHAEAGRRDVDLEWLIAEVERLRGELRGWEEFQHSVGQALDGIEGNC
jgi:hypothetical protein